MTSRRRPREGPLAKFLVSDRALGPSGGWGMHETNSSRNVHICLNPPPPPHTQSSSFPPKPHPTHSPNLTPLPSPKTQTPQQVLDGSDSEWDGSSSDSSSSSSSDSDESEAEDQPKGRARWLKRVPVGGEKAKEEKKKTQQLGGAWHCVAWRRPFLPFFLGCRSTDRWSIHPHNERNRTCLPCPCLQRISHNFTPHPPPPPTTTADGEHVSRRKKKEAAAAAAAATQQRANLLYDDELTLPDFKKKVAEAVASRGRRSTGTAELLRQLQHLAYVGRRFGLAEEAPVAMHLILAMFETRRAIDEPMDVALWRQCAAYLLRLLALLEAEPRKVLRNAADGEDALVTALGRTSLVSEEGDGGAGGRRTMPTRTWCRCPGPSATSSHGSRTSTPSRCSGSTRTRAITWPG